ncbi:hypothetical protein BDV29DRAFT_156203 [Aspergillus leporis]|uniref:Uncharacterized protein n=1 Tax=Aspergillus leporis TaxID=41062 RepID=A0A5N5X2C0_9EURO|nr:hypothetical protein BDV29DRAFT_156203 [Aspergillus leporis]
MAARECQRLGLMFQVTGLHTSFAAVEDGGFEVLARGTLSKHPPKIHIFALAKIGARLGAPRNAGRLLARPTVPVSDAAPVCITTGMCFPDWERVFPDWKRSASPGIYSFWLADPATRNAPIP